MGVAPQSEFLTVDPVRMAQIIAAAGTVDEATATVVTADPLDQILRIKSASSGQLGTADE